MSHFDCRFSGALTLLVLVVCLHSAVLGQTNAVPPLPANSAAELISSELIVPTGDSVPACCPVLPPLTQQTVTDVVVLIDSTVSMSRYSERESRLSIAQWLSLDLTDAIPDQQPAAFVSLFDEASEMRQLVPFVGDERSQLRRSVMQLRPMGDGKLDKLLNEASRLLVGKPEAVPLIVLVTDGMDCDPFSHGGPIRTLKQQFQDRLHFQVIGICDNTLISAKLRDLASQAGSNGDFSSVKSYAELPTALTKVRAVIDAVVQRRNAERRWCIESLNCCSREVQILSEKNAELLASNEQLSQQVQDLSMRNR